MTFRENAKKIISIYHLLHLLIYYRVKSKESDTQRGQQHLSKVLSKHCILHILAYGTVYGDGFSSPAGFMWTRQGGNGNPLLGRHADTVRPKLHTCNAWFLITGLRFEGGAWRKVLYVSHLNITRCTMQSANQSLSPKPESFQ